MIKPLFGKKLIALAGFVHLYNGKVLRTVTIVPRKDLYLSEGELLSVILERSNKTEYRKDDARRDRRI